MKVQAGVYIEYKYIKKARKMGLNISAVANEALRVATGSRMK